MSETIVLGIDCGGTHTDAALLAVEGTAARLLASAKTITDHADCQAPSSVCARALKRPAMTGQKPRLPAYPG